MIKAINCAMLSVAIEELKKIVKENEERERQTVVFCEDRLSLAAERAVCSAVDGTFLTSVYTFARFLSAEKGKAEDVLSAQGSAMAVRRIIEEKKSELKLFKKLQAADAAQSIYDTIALLYSSRISPEEVLKASNGGGMLGGKLHDLALIYSEYERFLKESGKQDRNGYLKQLASVLENSSKIKGSTVIFLGFQAFTCTVTECARAVFSAAENVYGLFIGGAEDIYVNEASSEFLKAAKDFGGAALQTAGGERNVEAEALRRGLFNPESVYGTKTVSQRVRVFEAADAAEELEFIAACIKKHVFKDGVRYAKISVMLPDLENSERELARVFKRYCIPYYADRQFALSEHALCTFVINYLLCVLSGCRPEDVDGVVASSFFPSERADKDAFRNYALRLANFRGGVKREPDGEILLSFGFDFERVERVRKRFLKGLEILTASGNKSGIYRGIEQLFDEFGIEKKLKDVAERYLNERPAEAQFNARAYESVLKVVGEAGELAGEKVKLGDFIKILKSGFSAMKISLIPPKADAVFVGDLTATANTGSDVVFAAHLTGGVPDTSPDCSLLTDREISALEGVNLNISPKIRQVNLRKREIAALNICAFRKLLYLLYPVCLKGEESGKSEIVLYSQAVFKDKEGGALKPAEIGKLERERKYLPYYCSEKLPAIRRLQKGSSGTESDSVYEVLKLNGFEREAVEALKKSGKRAISCGQQLYTSFNSLSPTALETYFLCPYLSFLRQGLKVREREEGVVRAVDTGNFIHAVLQDIAPETADIQSVEQLKIRAREIAENKLKKPPYSSLTDSKSGAYTAGELVEEAVAVSEGMYEQLKNSKFGVFATECAGRVELGAGVNVYGRIDRVDTSGDMVRIIDYKTGAIDASAAKYYSGVKLQLPLYLLSASEDRRAVGAYYFPASVEFKEKKDGVFRLQGFMDGSDDVVEASDTLVEQRQKSRFVDAYLGVKRIDSAMSREDFSAFLEYSRLIAAKGAGEMLAGNVTPSPSEDACKYCKAGGSCNFALGRDGEERRTGTVKCADIAKIVKKVKGDGND